jgi:hypothetical protein
MFDQHMSGCYLAGFEHLASDRCSILRIWPGMVSSVKAIHSGSTIFAYHQATKMLQGLGARPPQCELF